MQRQSFRRMGCPVARSLEHVGEWWSILILRDALSGLSRFDEFQRSLDIAPTTLTRRLNALVASGLLQKRRYSEHPPRYNYILTARGRDFRPVVQTLMAWGNQHLAPEGPSVIIVNEETGAAAEPLLIDRISGRPLSDAVFRSVAGPAADADMRKRYGRAPGKIVEQRRKPSP